MPQNHKCPPAYQRSVLWSCIGIHGNDFLVDIGDIFLALFDHLWLECGLAILWDFDVHTAIAAIDALGFITVTVVVCV